jgi:hypothetical protein
MPVPLADAWGEPGAFAAWMREVDGGLRRELGFDGPDDGPPDALWRAYYEDGLSPAAAVESFLRSVGEILDGLDDEFGPLAA